jgi:hypothetical protein
MASEWNCYTKIVTLSNFNSPLSKHNNKVTTKAEIVKNHENNYFLASLEIFKDDSNERL